MIFTLYIKIIHVLLKKSQKYVLSYYNFIYNQKKDILTCYYC